MSATTAHQPARTEEMAVVHRVFRQGFPMVAELVRGTPPGATARSEPIAAHLDFLLRGIHHHHTGEDTNIWPLLLERAAPQAELIDRMEAQHAVVDDRSARVRALLDAWRPSATHGEPLAAAIDEFTLALVEHLDDEEAHVVPLIRTHVTAAEWERFGQETFEKFTNPEKLIATGTLEDVATAEEAAWFTGGLPIPIKVMWRLAGRRKYARYIAGVRGTPRPRPLLRQLFRGLNRLAVALYRRSGGRIGGTAKGIPVLLITAPGRRTGSPHTVPVAYIEHNGGYIVTGSAGGANAEPQWFRNVRATDRVRIEIGHESYDADVLVPDTTGRDLLWQDVVLNRAPFFSKYEEKAARTIPVAVLTPRQT
ncbi:nitroreductase family deazaflavin-dependent oxidoreductase [Phytoactinopolyspora alkaliphila]|uniref:Nitroreductase family deazaflavin-dependent oxidoreductase n=1 Tax=Phytoactinopolyspora alkaliphila TaxID=1783498 RepID=A0A6N9YQW4_9ACTN|nr:nitroreductase/quinone reductase family protein [Phytoactinopolyspora alkaliphila]NED97451.1 nitroreductase family deazaflavin-dependent oxidoreductase [Phytoactinopolyspora alkaliphila]